MVAYSKKLISSSFELLSTDKSISLGHIDIKEDLNISFNKFKHILHHYTNNQGREVSLLCENIDCLNEPNLFFGLHIKDIVFFCWESKTDTIHYKLEILGTFELLNYWLLHVVLPMFFTIEDQYSFLHAGAVEVGGKPILFLAESFGGKSTMTDFFIQEGHTMISDDKVGTFEENGTFFSVPSYPYHRPYRKAEDIGIYVENFATQTKPIHAFYALEQADEDAIIEINEIIGIEKFYLLRLSSQFNISFQKKKRFQYLSHMSNNIKLYRVKVPWDLNRLHEVYRTIVTHVENSNI